MADVLPFRGILYNPEKIKDFSDVIAPPYDVISPKEQEQFHQRHPHNVIRLILGRTHETDTPENNRYTRAANYLKNWKNEKILVRDEKPALYLNSVAFPVEEKTVVRYGLIALVRLEPFEKGIILPHEKTFSKVKSERLELRKACHANFSPVFSLYSDKEGILDSLKDAAVSSPPDMSMTDSNGFEQNLWKIADPLVHEQITEAMADKTIFIADGHHRYETALNYRDWVARNTAGFNENHPANFIMMSLSSMEDPGLVILPAHRILSQVGDHALDSFARKAEKYFDMEIFDFGPSDMDSTAEKFIAALRSDPIRSCLGAYIKKQNRFFLLKLKNGVMEKLFGDEIPRSLRKLDVTVLTRLVFMEILEFDQERLDNEKLIAYSSVAKDAIRIANDGDYEVVFILNPTKMEQVGQVAREGLIMPRKSTYFFPKVISGIVFNSLLP